MKKQAVQRDNEKKERAEIKKKHREQHHRERADTTDTGDKSPKSRRVLPPTGTLLIGRTAA